MGSGSMWIRWVGGEVVVFKEEKRCFLECEEDVNKSPLIRRERCRRRATERTSDENTLNAQRSASVRDGTAINPPHYGVLQNVMR